MSFANVAFRLACYCDINYFVIFMAVSQLNSWINGSATRHAHPIIINSLYLWLVIEYRTKPVNIIININIIWCVCMRLDVDQILYFTALIHILILTLDLCNMHFDIYFPVHHNNNNKRPKPNIVEKKNHIIYRIISTLNKTSCTNISI